MSKVDTHRHYYIGAISGGLLGAMEGFAAGKSRNDVLGDFSEYKRTIMTRDHYTDAFLRKDPQIAKILDKSLEYAENSDLVKRQRFNAETAAAEFLSCNPNTTPKYIYNSAYKKSYEASMSTVDVIKKEVKKYFNLPQNKLEKETVMNMYDQFLKTPRGESVTNSVSSAKKILIKNTLTRTVFGLIAGVSCGLLFTHLFKNSSDKIDHTNKINQ